MKIRHPLLAFFALAYGISWLLWAPLWLPAFGVHGLPVFPFNVRQDDQIDDDGPLTGWTP